MLGMRNATHADRLLSFSRKALGLRVFFSRFAFFRLFIFFFTFLVSLSFVYVSFLRYFLFSFIYLFIYFPIPFLSAARLQVGNT